MNLVRSVCLASLLLIVPRAYTLVESTTGGFKFPDGTTQITAAAPFLRAVSVVTANATAVAGTAYLANASSPIVITLPSACIPGDQVQVVAMNTGGWQVVANSGQKISDALGSLGQTGGSINSVNAADSMLVTCTVANTKWVITQETNRHYAGYQLATYGSTRYWADGTYASSCKTYRSPGPAYSYAGPTGDGLYRISPSGTPYDVFCDMTTDGGGWTLNLTMESITNANTATTQFKDANVNAGATEVMTFYASTNSGYPALTTKFKFPKPSGFDPFTAPGGTAAVTVTNLTSAAISSGSSVVFGSGNFSHYTCDAWDTSTNYGRFGMCIGGGNGTSFDDFPYFNGYNTSGADSCSLSTQTYNATSCSSSRFFVIFER